ncbi:MAG: HEAT repeat domain-containing protein [Candidatus Odinarchaeota archaeon]
MSFVIIFVIMIISTFAVTIVAGLIISSINKPVDERIKGRTRYGTKSDRSTRYDVPAKDIIDFHIERLESKESAMKIYAASALGGFNDSRAVEPLIRALNSKSSEVCLQCITSLGKLGDTRAIGPLLSLLYEDNRYILRAIYQSLKNLNSETDVCKSLVAYLVDKKQSVSNTYLLNALELIKEISPDVNILLPIKNLLFVASVSQSTAIREIASFILNRFPCAVVEEREDYYEQYDFHPNNSDTDPIENLLKALNSKNELVLNNAVLILGEKGEKRATERFIDILSTFSDCKNTRLIYNTIKALGKIGDSLATEPLLEFISQGNPSIREAAVWSLGEICDPRATSHLLELLNDENESVKLAAIEAIGKIGKEAEVKSLIEIIPEFITDFSPYHIVRALRKMAGRGVDVANPLIDLFSKVDVNIELGSDGEKYFLNGSLDLLIWYSQSPDQLKPIESFLITLLLDKIVHFSKSRIKTLLFSLHPLFADKGGC